MNKKLLLAITFAFMFLSGGLFAQNKTAVFTDGFESESLSPNWTIVDSDGDGFNWEIGAAPGYNAHGGSFSMISGSYDSDSQTALTPDNWAISSQMTLTEGCNLIYYVAAQDASYAAEKYGVYISTTDTDLDSFTELFSETMTAKGSKHVGAKGTNEPGTWYKRTIDLSDYTGDVYIAFRHYDCSDMFYLKIDDVQVSDEEIIVPDAPTGLEATLDGSKIELNWDAVENGIFTVNCNGDVLATGLTTNSYVHNNLVIGSYCYTVKVTVNEVESAESDEVCKDVESGYILNSDFEELSSIGPLPIGWTAIDGDGDGNSWMGLKDAVIPIIEGWLYDYIYGHSGTGLLASPSADVTVNNYLVSPMIDLGNEGVIMTYYANAFAQGFPEHYGVYISSSATDTANFELLFEETISAEKALFSKVNKKVKVQASSTTRNTKDYPETEWMAHQIDLSAFSGEQYIIFRHFNTTDQNYLILDDVVAKVGEPYAFDAPTNVTATADGFNVNVNWNKVDGAPAYDIYCNGALLKSVPGVTSFFKHKNLMNGTYSYQVVAKNDFTTSDPSDAAEVEIAGSPIFLVENFDNSNSIPDTWTTIDADGDGYNWGIYSGNSAPNSAASASWVSSSKLILYPDNWLISPAFEVQEGSSFMYSVAGNSYGEFYGIYVSTGGTDTADFEEVFSETVSTSPFADRNIDLSDYVGSTIHVAFRHYNCSDGMRLRFDDIAVLGSALFDCGIPENLQAGDVYTMTANLTWNTVEGAKSYNVYQLGEDTAVVATSAQGAAKITGLTPETSYVFAVTSVCEYAESEMSESIEITTNASSVSLGDTIFFEDFETLVSEEIMPGWAIADEDGDGNNWYGLKDAGDPIIMGHSGTGFMTSASYAGAALNPDNWLITPAINIGEDGAAVVYWVNAQDASWAGEKYGVYISTDSIVDNFTELFVETLTAKSTKNAGARGTNAQGAWYKRTVAIPSTFTGEVRIAFRHFDCTDMFRMNLDDVAVLAAEGDATVAVPENLAADVDMDAVTLSWDAANNAISYAIFQKLSDTTNTVVAKNINGTEFVIDGLANGTYSYAVMGEGEMGNSELSAYVEVVVESGVVNVFCEDFETVTTYGFIEGWSAIDADGDGQFWGGVYDVEGVKAHSGVGLMASESYTESLGALTPDNWLITPKITLNQWNNVLSFYIGAQDATYPNEKFAVYISTSEPSIENFTELFTETMTSKAQGNWYRKTADLSNYSGDIYIAFRHYESFDQFRLNLDDVCITASPTAIENNVAENTVSVFPVPAKDVLNVETTENFTNYEVYNVVGQVIARNVVTSNNFQINTSVLKKGIYFIRMNGNGNSSIAKFVVE